MTPLQTANEFELARTEAGTSRSQIAVLIPAYKPGIALPGLVSRLSELGFLGIIVVDDGGGPEFFEVFRELRQIPSVHVVRHALNLGKGAALKTGVNYLLSEFSDLAGVVTADADGQHRLEDIEAVAEALALYPDKLILGVRAFDVEVPLRSKFGNSLTRLSVKYLIGQSLSDTQTGLRGIPCSLMPNLLRLPSNGYEFELEMLLSCKHRGITIREVPIKTIYEDGNKSSHFNPLIDSCKIYFVLLRFVALSASTTILDNLLFYAVYKNSHEVLRAQIVSRCVALLYQYLLVRGAVFHSHEPHRSTLPKFLLLVLLSASFSYAFIQAAHTMFGADVMLAKILGETVLFFANFAIQRDFVFTRRRRQSN